MRGGLLRNGVVTVADDGTVLDVSTEDNPDTRAGVEFYSGILIPGLVNAHTHLELSHMRGLIAEGCGFTGFASGMAAKRGAVDATDRLACASYRHNRMWSEGVSAVGDICNSGLTFPLKNDGKITYHSFIEVYGLRTLSAEGALTLTREARISRLRASVTPHSMYSLGEELMKEAVGSDDRLLSIHFMESPEETELFRRRGKMWEWYRREGYREDFTAVYGSPAERLVRRVGKERKVLLVHNTFTGREEVEMVNYHFGENVTWVLCPRSNRYITGETPPVEMLRKRGCRIAVGTDSLASNSDLSLTEELKLFPGVPLVELLTWATLNGAEALGIEDRSGSIEPGKRPGIVLVEDADLNKMEMTARTTTRRIV